MSLAFRLEDDDGRRRESGGGTPDRLLLPAVGPGGRLPLLLPEDPTEAVGTRLCARSQELETELNEKFDADVNNYFRAALGTILISKRSILILFFSCFC